ncbi:hypothetical protein NDU88_002735 [Pleurodeles waltl]|uniref:Uncharacterized protein n=1 Tax=Pleurodeles waltl TaxID=8319 RepID=A0AAV7VDP3_PLEWA|nr:hypothetical protein NDU88_002735 [Pleurodeles waltl]
MGRYLSDHAPLLFEHGEMAPGREPVNWCLKADAILEAAFRQMIVEAITEYLRGELDADITVEKLKKELDKMDSGKAPGGDGFPVEFYQAYGVQLVEPLLEVFRETEERWLLPNTLQEGMVCMIPKPGRYEM